MIFIEHVININSLPFFFSIKPIKKLFTLFHSKFRIYTFGIQIKISEAHSYSLDIRSVLCNILEVFKYQFKNALLSKYLFKVNLMNPDMHSSIFRFLLLSDHHSHGYRGMPITGVSIL